MFNNRPQIFEDHHNSSGLTSEQRRLLCDVLSCFLCPLKCDDIGCPFGHFGEGLRKLPSCMCIKHLLSRCKNNTIPESDPLQCFDGFHPSAEDLIDLENFNEKVALVLMRSRLPSAKSSFISSKRARSNSMSTSSANNNSPSKAVNASTSNGGDTEEDDPNECAICWENPRTRGQHFGLLENCSHVFCASCLTGWITTGDQKACPMCRVYSCRAIIWPESQIDSEQKKRIFDYNLLCVQVYQQNQPVIDQGTAQGAVNAQGNPQYPRVGLTVRTMLRTYIPAQPARNGQPVHRFEPINRMIRVHRTNEQGEMIPMNITTRPPAGMPMQPAGPPMPPAGPQMPPAGPPQIFPDHHFHYYQNRPNQYGPPNVPFQYAPPPPPPNAFPLFQPTMQQQMAPWAGPSTMYPQPMHHSIGPLPAHTGPPPRPTMQLNPNATPYQPLDQRYQQQQQLQPAHQPARNASDWNFNCSSPATNAPNAPNANADDTEDEE